MSSLTEKRTDALEYAGITLFGLYFAGLAALVATYVNVI